MKKYRASAKVETVIGTLSPPDIDSRTSIDFEGAHVRPQLNAELLDLLERASGVPLKSWRFEDQSRRLKLENGAQGRN